MIADIISDGGASRTTGATAAGADEARAASPGGGRVEVRVFAGSGRADALGECGAMEGERVVGATGAGGPVTGGGYGECCGGAPTCGQPPLCTAAGIGENAPLCAAGGIGENAPLCVAAGGAALGERRCGCTCGGPGVGDVT